MPVITGSAICIVDSSQNLTRFPCFSVYVSLCLIFVEFFDCFASPKVLFRTSRRIFTKMPRVLCQQVKEIISSLIIYFEQERDNKGPLLPLTAVRERVAAAANVSIWTVSKISSSVKPQQALPSCSKTRNKSKPIVDIDEASEAAIRNVIYQMYHNREHITRSSLLCKLKERDLFSGGISSLGKVLKNIGFTWKKGDPRRGLMEQHHIALLRVEFLQRYVKNMGSNNPQDTVYLDETWIFENGSNSHSWQDSNRQSVKKLKTDGKRYIILHAGNKDGFIPGASLMFCSKTKGHDYHGEMNKENFTKWFTMQLLPNIKPNSIIIMDNASYHSELTNKAPDASWRKSNIQEWLTNNNIAYDPSMLKQQLLHLVALHKPPKEYVIDKLACAHGHTVLRLPPYHCIFNPIENIWGITKTYYNRHIGRDGYGINNCMKMWDEALATLTQTTWSNSIHHTEAEIIRWWEREVGLDRDEISPLIINLNDDSSSDSDIEEN